ncbi:MAG: NADH-quinone oxidoreductase subunit J [Azospirillum sp.]|nr:NADH-quinone oxidoreductase subunit J [Azospirillum sp.]
MVIQSIVFYVFSCALLICGVMVISARNPVHSVLWLIAAFFQAAGLFVLMGAEFLAMILVIVYVGAVAVLFLFVVMMLDINFVELRRGVVRYLPIGGLIGLVLVSELVAMVSGWVPAAGALAQLGAPVPPVDQISNTRALGQLIYTQYFYLFQTAGMILLVAMIGAIVLTLRSREGVRRQNVPAQLARRREDVVAVRKVPTRGGV